MDLKKLSSIAKTVVKPITWCGFLAWEQSLQTQRALLNAAFDLKTSRTPSSPSMKFSAGGCYAECLPLCLFPEDFGQKYGWIRDLESG